MEGLNRGNRNYPTMKDIGKWTKKQVAEIKKSSKRLDQLLKDTEELPGNLRTELNGSTMQINSVRKNMEQSALFLKQKIHKSEILLTKVRNMKQGIELGDSVTRKLEDLKKIAEISQKEITKFEESVRHAKQPPGSK